MSTLPRGHSVAKRMEIGDGQSMAWLHQLGPPRPHPFSDSSLVSRIMWALPDTLSLLPHVPTLHPKPGVLPPWLLSFFFPCLSG